MTLSDFTLRGTPEREYRGYCRRCAAEHRFENDMPLAVRAMTDLFVRLERDPVYAAVRAALAASRGKMIGVLVLESGRVLQGYSGELAGRRDWPDWVAPVLRREDTERLEVETLARIKELDLQIVACDVDGARQRFIGASEARRAAILSRDEAHRSKTDVTRARRAQEDASADERLAREAFEAGRARLQELRGTRRVASQRLSTAMFDVATLTNARGVRAPLRKLFEGRGIVGGTTDCTVPKLLEAANVAQERPIALAEAWWGPTINGRLHGDLQPPCVRKCQPILGQLLCSAR